MTDKSEKPEKSEKKGKLIHEQVKERHTSHWDLDYLSRAELEQLMAKSKRTNSADKATGTDSEPSTGSEQDKE